MPVMQTIKVSALDTTSDKTRRSGSNSGTALIRCALVMAVLVGAVLSYWSSATLEQVMMPGTNAAIRVQTFAKDGSDPAVILSDLNDLARSSGGTIYVNIPHPEGKTVYAAGTRTDDWITHGYTGILGSPSITVVELSQLPHGDYRQILELTGGRDFYGEVSAYLTEHGAQHEFMVFQPWTLFAGVAALGDLTKLLVGFCVALCVIGVMLNSHADAVRRLHGYGIWQSTIHELKRAAGWAAPIMVALVVLGIVGLGLLTNVYSAIQLAIFNALLIGGSLVVCVGSIVLSLIGLRQLSIVSLLAGKLPGKTVLAGVYAIRVGAGVMVLMMLIAAVNHSTEWLRQHSEVQRWANAGEAYALELSGARSADDLLASGRDMATKLREISTEHRLLYAQYNYRGSMPTSGLDRDVMVYNETAARQSLSGPLRDAFMNAPRDGRLLWLQPDNLPKETNIAMLQQLSSESIQVDGEWETVIYPAGSSQAFTWETSFDEWINPAETPDPIVAVFPDDNIPVNDRNLAAALTQSDVMLTDYADYQRLQSDEQVGSFIRSADNVASKWASNHQQMSRNTWVYLGGFVAGVLLSFIAALALLYSCLRVLHQRLRASYIHGVWPRGIMWGIAGAEIMTLIVYLAFLWNRGALVRGWTNGPMAGAAEPSLMALFSVPTVAWWFAVVLSIVLSLPVTALWLRRYSINQLIHTRK